MAPTLITLSQQEREERRIIRMAISAVALVLHTFLATVFWSLGLPQFVLISAIAVAWHGVGLLLSWRVRSALGIWVSFLEATIHQPLMILLVGGSAGFAYYFVLIAGAAALAFARSDVIAIGLAMGGAASGTAVGLGIPHFWPPLLPIAPEVANVLHTVNCAASVGGMCLVGLFFVRSGRLAERYVAALEGRVKEALRLGQYTLTEKIGEGGMGAVYRARHALLRRPTAVKLLPLDQLDEISVERFEREVQLTSELTHPNTIAIYDYGRSPGGMFYYVMEYLDGIDLESLVAEEGPLPPGRVVQVLMQVCEALDEAHDHGLVHRDVKPANIILCMRGNRPDVAKVLDFGLVKELDGDDGVTLANVNVVAGTPAYLAPEALTASEPVGPWSDLYSLGAVGYYLLTGTVVFEGTAAEMCAHHIHTVPDRPSSRMGEALPAELEDLILKCLAKKPAERPASARALRDAFAELTLKDEWNESQALAWWTSFYERKKGGTSINAPSRVNLTVELHGRH